MDKHALHTCVDLCLCVSIYSAGAIHARMAFKLFVIEDIFFTAEWSRGPIPQRDSERANNTSVVRSTVDYIDSIFQRSLQLLLQYINSSVTKQY